MLKLVKDQLWKLDSTFTFKNVAGGLQKVFEPTCAHAWWALMHHFVSVCHWTKIHWIIIHISEGIAPSVMEFGMGMYRDDIWVDL